jgi:pimeloyl-ACP methyl ester carboxylesterase
MPVLEFQSIRLSYVLHGKGKNVLLAFHGFGQNKEQMQSWLQPLEAHFTIYSFDLFFHGESHWPNGERSVTKKVFQNLMQRFLEKESLQKISLFGFSMGGKFALTFFQMLPRNVEGVYLAAPDGIKKDFWYQLATFPIGMQQLFRYLTRKPGLLFKFTEVLSETGIMDESLVRFSESQLLKPEDRERVYYCWIVFKKLHVSMRTIGKICHQWNIPIRLFLGKKDSIIRAEAFKSFDKTVPGSKTILLDSGHGRLPPIAIEAWALNLEKS